METGIVVFGLEVISNVNALAWLTQPSNPLSWFLLWSKQDLVHAYIASLLRVSRV